MFDQEILDQIRAREQARIVATMRETSPATMLERMEREEPAPCGHGNLWYCGLCAAEAAPKCVHGNPFYCGFCGVVASSDHHEAHLACIVAALAVRP
jgi:hypothetical protein